MLNILLFVAGLVTFAFALGWHPTVKWDSVTAIGTGAWAGVRTIFTAPLNNWQALYRRVLVVLAVLAVVLGLLIAPSESPRAVGIVDAVKTFQSDHGLNPDGVWGIKTNAAYIAYLKGH